MVQMATLGLQLFMSFALEVLRTELRDTAIETHPPDKMRRATLLHLDPR